eukprot:11287184-Ditylum_brightwellii.AAC.1
MDANNDDQVQSDFRRLYCQNDLVDVFAHLHPGVPPPNTYQRGDNCIDYLYYAGINTCTSCNKFSSL